MQLVQECSPSEIRFIEYCIHQRAFAETRSQPPIHSPKLKNSRESLNNTDLSPNLLYKLGQRISLNYFDMLCDELLLQIVRHLHSPNHVKSLAHCSQLNHRWNRLMADDAVWKQFCLNRNYNPIAFTTRNAILERSNHVNIQQRNSTPTIASRNNRNQILDGSNTGHSTLNAETNEASSPRSQRLFSRNIGSLLNTSSGSLNSFTRPSGLSPSNSVGSSLNLSGTGSNPANSRTPIAGKQHSREVQSQTSNHPSKIPRLIGLPASWKKVYKENYLTWMNWMQGSFKVRPMQHSNGDLYMHFNDTRAVSVKLGEPAKLVRIYACDSSNLFNIVSNECIE